MIFPVTILLDERSNQKSQLRHLHPKGLDCPNRRASIKEAREFRTAQRTQLTDYRCNQCGTVCNPYTATFLPTSKHGTYENDPPPVIGTVGRETGQLRARCGRRNAQTNALCTLTCSHGARLSSTDEWRSRGGLTRPHSTVCHGKQEWARDDIGDGINDLHVNTIERSWTHTRDCLRPFRGVHKRNLQYYLAVCEFRINQKQVSPSFTTKPSAQQSLSMSDDVYSRWKRG